MVNVHYLADQMEAHLAARTAPRIVVSDERDALLESGGGVKKALPLLGDGRSSCSTPTSSGSTGRAQPRCAWRQAWIRRGWTCCCCSLGDDDSFGYDGRGDFVMDPCGR